MWRPLPYDEFMRQYGDAELAKYDEFMRQYGDAELAKYDIPSEDDIKRLKEYEARGEFEAGYNPDEWEYDDEVQDVVEVDTALDNEEDLMEVQN